MRRRFRTLAIAKGVVLQRYIYKKELVYGVGYLVLNALDSKGAEMVAIIGRRRVGKTFLINKVYGENIQFEVTGIQFAPRAEQIKNFIF